jgi:energy-coupling factor transporter ATP-binding protein EcfA2
MGQLVSEQANDHSEAELTAKLAVAEKKFAEVCQEVESRRDAELQTAESEFQAENDRITTAVRKTSDEVETTYRDVSEQATAECEKERVDAEQTREDAHFEIHGIAEAGKNGLKSKYGDLDQGTDPVGEGIETRRNEAKHLLKEYKRSSLADEPAPPAALQQGVNLQAAMQEGLKVADAKLAELKSLKLPKFITLGKMIVFFILFGGIGAGAAFFALNGNPNQIPITAGAGLGGGLFLTLMLWVILRSTASGHISAAYQPLAHALAYTELARQQWQHVALAAYRKEMAAIEERCKRDDAKNEEACRTRMAKAVEKRDQVLAKARDKHDRHLAELNKRRDAALAKAEAVVAQRRKEIPVKYDQELQKLKQQFELQTAEGRQAVQAAKQRRIDRWHKGVAHVQQEAAEINAFCDRLAPPWEALMTDAWKPAEAVPPVVKVGQWEAGPKQFSEEQLNDEDHAPDLDGVSGLASHEEEDVEAKEERFQLPVIKQPALLAFPERSSVLFKSTGKGRDRAIEIMQSAMLRLSTTIPPGKVRYTVIDPIGLGQNFAAFMHLADFDEQLIGARIWTESGQIETRLADLTEQMEVVIQKYLRNEFETIEDYNAEAGEVAEPFRYLVVANFPANFSEAACRRLVSIVSSGARCGVHTLISVDTKMQMPQGFKLSDLEQHCVNFIWKDDHFQWKDQDFGALPLTLDKPPAVDLFTQIVRRAGESAKNASKVEVPFRVIAPRPEEWWKGDTRGGIRVSLGPAGATKQQHLELGKGTSQHVLVAGKTGSGKSTLLHTLITNLALVYSPEEIELYLIDFKKGVEFKTYATFALPHARVVSVESDREFGLSVLQRLDGELKVRGEKFRDTGAQDVSSYRRVTGESLPRIMLIIDEFQEFFVEDDKVAQDVGLLFDRLVRQGRAFGIHVLLGSQTLGGAYSLARTTLGQMGVRIALQCSDADAHLILSEENSAARLLSRPGEAIYNDAGGLPDANHPFQVAFLPDVDKEDYLTRIQNFSHERNGDKQYPLIVFEGNVPGMLDKNPLLDTFLQSEDWPNLGNRAPLAFLGDPVAIKDPTAALMRRQSGHNLLLIGQNDLQALGILAAATVGLAAQVSPMPANGGRAKFFILDGTPPESPNAGFFEKVAAIMPHDVRVGGMRDVPAFLNEIANEVTRRQTANQTDAPPWFLILHDLQRFRDLRKKDDDFGFSRMGEEQAASPAQQLGNILREGPGLGVSVMTWCDTLNNLQRTFDRQALRELELRVLFQMSQNDSSSLIDSPAASRLGPQRALFHSEEVGALEKFRPYGLPTDEWLASVKERFFARPLPPPPEPPAPPPPAEPKSESPGEPASTSSSSESMFTPPFAFKSILDSFPEAEDGADSDPSAEKTGGADGANGSHGEGANGTNGSSGDKATTDTEPEGAAGG